MRRRVILSAASVVIAVIPWIANGQDSKAKMPKAAATAGAIVVGTPVTSTDEQAIRQTGDTYVAAFNQANTKLLAEHYTEEAEYVDDSGSVYRGRTAIEETLKKFFTANPQAQIELKIDSIRLIGSGIAIEDGTTTVTPNKDADPVTTRYTVIHQKNAGKWLIASVRETIIRSVRQHRAQLHQLDWMLGEWVHEGTDAVVFFSCEIAEKGNFLVRNFTIQVAGEEAMSGTQRIGWDAQAGKLKCWIFDSDGGHSEGYWHRDGDNWVLKVTGVTADGQSASATSIYTAVNEHTMLFQTVDHEISGVELPDGFKLKIVRHAPQPE